MAWFTIAVASLALSAGLFVWLVRIRRRMRLLIAAREKAMLDLQTLQQTFHRFAPQRVVEDILKRGVSISGESREVTVFFADIAGFTAMSESIDPTSLVRVLNGYFETLDRVIGRRGGTLSKFLGDGVMALFGAPETNVWQAMDAVIAAVDARQAIAEYNCELAAEGLPPIDVRMGIHQGTVVAGVVGSKENMEYTVLGDAVNTAARIESLTRRHGVDILVSARVRAALDDRFRVRELPPEKVKGKTEPVVTYAVESFKG